EPTFAQAEQQLFASSDGVTRGRLLSAMASVRDPALSARVLDLGLDGRLRMNERLLPLLGQSGMPETREAAFRWLTEHYDALLAGVGRNSGHAIIGSAGSFCSEDKAREVEAFFGTRSDTVAGGPRELAL